MPDGSGRRVYADKRRNNARQSPEAALWSLPVADSNPHAEALIERFGRREATVAVVGLGYVGLPLAGAMHQAGHTVLGYDTDASKIECLRRGEAYLRQPGAEIVASLASSERFRATGDAGDLRHADAVILCVPTPLGPHHEPDLSAVRASTEMVADVLRPGQIVSLESTTYPGTTREVCCPILERTGLTCGRDFFLVFSPERYDPGRRDFTLTTTPKLVGGVNESSTRVGVALYASAIQRVIPVSSAEVAEATKLLENVFRAVNIALVNELKPALLAMDIDVWEVIAAAATKPFGYMPFWPGPGLGGHCIPIDPFYLSWRARQFGQRTRLIELAGRINRAMPRYVVRRVVQALRDEGRRLRGADVLIIGLAYKPDVDDVRETPAAELIRLLHARGVRVGYHDPYVPTFPRMRRYRFDLVSQPLTPERLARADCVLIATHHSVIDWTLVGRTARLIVDTRNVMATVAGVTARVVKA